MFHRVTDASKAAVVATAGYVFADGDPRRLIDVQWATDHLRSLGVVTVSRARLPRPARAGGRPPATDLLGRDVLSGRAGPLRSPDRAHPVCRVVTLRRRRSPR